MATSGAADDFVLIVKGTKQDAENIRDECRHFLEGKLKLTLNMEKTHLTHVNDGFVFLGHRIVRKRGLRGNMRVLPQYQRLRQKHSTRTLVKELSGDFSCSMIDKVEKINQKLSGWSQFYRHTDFTAMAYGR